MAVLKLLLKVLFAVFFIVAGVGHFVNEPFYLKLMPDYIPPSLHRPAVHISGVAEMVLGALLLVPRTSRLAAWGLIALLVAVFPANIYAYQHSEEVFPGLDPRLHLGRLPLQAVMIAWAWCYTRPAGVVAGDRGPPQAAPPSTT